MNWMMIMTHKKKYILLISVLLIIVVTVITQNIYYINGVSIFVKIENKDNTCIVYFSKTLHFERDYVIYEPESAEISDLHVYYVNDTLYVKEQYLDIIHIESSNFNIKPVICKYGDKKRGEIDEWSDSTIFKKRGKCFTVNHRHGIYIYKEE